MISIHAPARGATTDRMLNSGTEHDFNPRSRKGSDTVKMVRRTYYEDFNPRSRKGSDSSGGEKRKPNYNFNPRSRKGSDLLDVIRTPEDNISIHAPARGATIITYWTPVVKGFQSTLPQGERPRIPARSLDEMPNFNPRSRKGSDDRIWCFLVR